MSSFLFKFKNSKIAPGTGFLFDSLTPGAVYDTVGWAVYAYYNKKGDILKMQKKGMNKNFSWDQSAQNYVGVYSEALLRGCGINTNDWK